VGADARLGRKVIDSGQLGGLVKLGSPLPRHDGDLVNQRRIVAVHLPA